MQHSTIKTKIQDLKIFYIDDEDDVITVSSQEELEELIKIAMIKNLKVNIMSTINEALLFQPFSSKDESLLVTFSDNFANQYSEVLSIKLSHKKHNKHQTGC